MNSIIFQQRIVSGMQPTGDVHLGNYLGAIVNWVDLQNNRPGNVLFTIVDLHSLTVEPDAESLTKATWDVAAALLASGIDPAKSTLFLQSRVSPHNELFNFLARSRLTNRF
jgi:tryptophanyl-tRNA synthetase